MARITLRTIHELQMKGNVEAFLRDEQLLGDFSDLICSKCKIGVFRLISNKSKADGKLWVCSEKKNGCFNSKQVRDGSFFFRSHLSLDTLLEMMYMWCLKITQETVQYEIHSLSSSTCVDWYQFCRDICTNIILDNHDGIGGDGHTVEIDESLFGKRKFNRGRRVDGQWVLGDIDGETKDIFLIPCPGNKRDAATLIPIIKRWVQPGTTVITDCWACLLLSWTGRFRPFNSQSQIVFCGPTTGAHTNTIESTWNAVKKSLPKSGTQPSFYQSYFLEYIFRKKYFTRGCDRFRVFLDKIKLLFPLSTVYTPASILPVFNPLISPSTSSAIDLDSMTSPSKIPKL